MRDKQGNTNRSKNKPKIALLYTLEAGVGPRSLAVEGVRGDDSELLCIALHCIAWLGSLLVGLLPLITLFAWMLRTLIWLCLTFTLAPEQIRLDSQFPMPCRGLTSLHLPF